jgi:hypothetical protein
VGDYAEGYPAAQINVAHCPCCTGTAYRYIGQWQCRIRLRCSYYRASACQRIRNEVTAMLGRRSHTTRVFPAVASVSRSSISRRLARN